MISFIKNLFKKKEAEPVEVEAIQPPQNDVPIRFYEMSIPAFFRYKGGKYMTIQPVETVIYWQGNGIPYRKDVIVNAVSLETGKTVVIEERSIVERE